MARSSAFCASSTRPRSASPRQRGVSPGHVWKRFEAGRVVVLSLAKRLPGGAGQLRNPQVEKGFGCPGTDDPRPVDQPGRERRHHARRLPAGGQGPHSRGAHQRLRVGRGGNQHVHQFRSDHIGRHLGPACPAGRRGREGGLALHLSAALRGAAKQHARDVIRCARADERALSAVDGQPSQIGQHAGVPRSGAVHHVRRREVLLAPHAVPPPRVHLLRRPFRCLVVMARGAGIRHAKARGHLRVRRAERVGRAAVPASAS